MAGFANIAVARALPLSLLISLPLAALPQLAIIPTARALETTTTRAQLAAELTKSFKQYKTLRKAGKTSLAIPHAKHALELAERLFRPANKTVASLLRNLAELYQREKRYKEAEPFYLRALAIRDKVLKADDPKIEAVLLVLARLYKSMSESRKATPFYERVLVIREKRHGPDHKKTGGAAWMLAKNYKYYGEYAKARPLFERVVAIAEKNISSDHIRMATIYGELGEVYQRLGHHSLSEPFLKQALAIKEKLYGREDRKLTGNLIDLYRLYQKKNLFTREIKLRKRVLNIQKKVFGDTAWSTQSSRQALARRYTSLGLFSEAETLYLERIAISEHRRGTDAKLNARAIMDLGKLYLKQGQVEKAEPLLKRAYALAINKDEPGFDNFNSRAFTQLALADLYDAKKQYGSAKEILQRVRKMFSDAGAKGDNGYILNGIFLADILQKMQRYIEAEKLFLRSLKFVEKRNKFNTSWLKDRILTGLGDVSLATGKSQNAEQYYIRAVAASEQSRGKGQLGTLNAISALVRYYASDQQWQKALATQRRATSILTSRNAREAQILSSNGKTDTSRRKTSEQNKRQFVRQVQLAFKVAHSKSSKGMLDQQDAATAGLTNEAFRSAHWALGSSAASALARMAARFSVGDRAISRKIRARQDLVIERQIFNKNLLRGLSRQGAKRDRKQEDKQRDKLNSLTVQLQALDRQIEKQFPDYAALANPRPLSIKQVQKLLGPDEALILLLDMSKEKSAPAQTFIWAVTREKVVWQRSDLGGKDLIDKVAALRRALDPTSGTRSAKSKRGMSSNNEEDFDLTLAHELYQKLLQPVEPLIADKKHLLIVASGALTALPFHVLVSQPPTSDLPINEGYRQAHWLVKRFAITTLPSISSLNALRGLRKKSQPAKLPLVGFADPVFSRGNQKPLAIASAGEPAKRGYASFFRGGTPDLSALSKLAPLPDTRTELEHVARTLHVANEHIRLGRAASENAVKTAKLDQYRIVYFATHGLVAGDIAGLAEPALAFSLPAKASARDDGLLTASEVSQLKLNADWLVMSACNTASGDKPGAEALSGLARAFFYAGARSLLVSHWPVYSDAATALTTKAFQLMDVGKKTASPIGRSQALRQSMLALLHDRSQDDNAHPGVWAPFVVVGEGAAR